MIDIKILRENPEGVQKAAKSKGIDINASHILEINKKYRELSLSVQKLREERNKQSLLFRRQLKSKFAKAASNAVDKKNIEKGKELKDKLEKEEHALKAVEEELYAWLAKIPNLPKPDVKIGKDESENKVIKKYKEPTKLDFTPKDHLEIGEALDIIDIKRAAKVSGARFYYLKNQAALLEFALIQFSFEVLLKEGFTPIIPPVLIKPEITKGLGYWQAGGNEDYYLVYDPKNNPEEYLKEGRDPSEYPGFYLVGTAEHSIVPMHKDEIFNIIDLPKRYVGFSSAFRREAGSYGKDTKGIFRVHQFDKVEMVSFVARDDDKEHEYLLSLEEKFFQLLNIPYQVVKMCTGDLGFPVARKYDIEAWIPSQNRYREVTSTSTTTDFQARRLNIRYQNSTIQNEKEYINILNGTALAIGRTIIAILENYQQKDGSVLMPEALKKYLSFSVISSKK